MQKKWMLRQKVLQNPLNPLYNKSVAEAGLPKTRSSPFVISTILEVIKSVKLHNEAPGLGCSRYSS